MDNDDNAGNDDRARLLEELAARGVLAGGVAEELAVPLARVHDALGAAVAELDKHFAEAKGPDPLPLATAIDIRERVGYAFLDIGRAARLAADLAYVVSSTAAATPPTGEVDFKELVTRAIALARHGLADDGDILSDMGTPPPVHADGTRLAHVLAHLILGATSDAGPGGQVNIATRATATGDACIHVTPERGTGLFAELINQGIRAAGGTLTRTGVRAEVILPGSTTSSGRRAK